MGSLTETSSEVGNVSTSPRCALNWVRHIRFGAGDQVREPSTP